MTKTAKILQEVAQFAPRLLARNTGVAIQSKPYSIPPDPSAQFNALADKHKPKNYLMTGALGQLGSGLAKVIRQMNGRETVIMSDIVKTPKIGDHDPYIYLDIMDQGAINAAVVNHDIDAIIHFSALLSATGERNVPLALEVNGLGVQNVLEVSRQHKLQVFIPSSIGAFGPTTPLENTPDMCVQRPRTIYGVTKVFAELLGEYYHERFDVDFRSLRFPGIISNTQPGGGTTDYAVQIFFDALSSGKHKCYLRPDTRLPMMYETDCIASVIFFLLSPSEKLTQRTYNVTGYSFTPEEIAAAIRKKIPKFEIEYEICPIRQKIADSWPKRLDDSCAKKDWNWNPQYDLDGTVDVMLKLIEGNKKNSGETVTV